MRIKTSAMTLCAVATLFSSFGLSPANASDVSTSDRAAAGGSCSYSQNGRSVHFTCYSSTVKHLEASILCNHSVPALKYLRAYRDPNGGKSGTRKFTLSCLPSYTVANPGWKFR